MSWRREKGQCSTNYTNYHLTSPARSQWFVTPFHISIHGQRGYLTCCFCCQNHRSHQWPMVVHPASRKWTMGQCFLCLRRGHLRSECRPRSCCASCQEWHHQSICDRTSCVQSCNYTPRQEGKHTHSKSSFLHWLESPSWCVPEQTENDYHQPTLSLLLLTHTTSKRDVCLHLQDHSHMNLTMHVLTIWESLVGQPVSTCQKRH